MLRPTSPFTEEVIRHAREGAAGLAAGLSGPGLRRAAAGLWSRRMDLAALALVFLAFHQAYFWTARRYLLAGILYPTDILYGWDTPRVVGDIVQPGHNDRSNVHPLFILFAKPQGLFYTRILGLTPHTAAIAVSSFMMASGTALMWILLRVLGSARPEASLFAAIYGSTCIAWFSGIVPETGVFAINALTIMMILAALRLVRGVNAPGAWIASGVFTYGITISNVVKNFLAYAVAFYPGWDRRARFARSIVHGTAVAGIAVILTMLLGSSRNLLADKWIATGEERGGHIPNIGLEILLNFFLYDGAGPTPKIHPVTFLGLLADTPVVSFNEAAYGPGGWILAACWVLPLAAGLAIGAGGRRPELRRFLAIPVFCVVWDCLFFSRYYVPFEGLLHWTAHTIAPLFALSAPRGVWLSVVSPAVRGAGWAGAAALAAALAVNNYGVVMESMRLLTAPG